MITIHVERCDGCGACLEACPHGALFLIEGTAVVDEALCRECEVCVPACPVNAIMVVQQLPTAQPTRVPAIRPEPEVAVVESPPAPVPLRVKVLPVVGAALSWAGRELVPRLAYYLLDELDRRATGQRASGIARGSSPSAARGGGRRQRRRRHRGGRDSPG
ncbi:MAG: 4Fe-4S dicluster domain-containing protein [Anaerolineae bacterium]|nr:4Fe-4S dicluster domain-containing protein [Anaerolineae bacterium]